MVKKIVMEIENRIIKSESELRVEYQDSNEMWVSGYALKFNQPSEILQSNGIRFIETIQPDAFTESELDDLRLLYEHDHKQILARSSAGTLTTEIRDEGLFFMAKLANTSYARDVYENLRSGNVMNCSFGFNLSENGDSIRYDSERDLYLRTVEKIDKISEITLTSIPAYKSSHVEVAIRSITEAKEKELEDIKKNHKRKLMLELELIKLKEELN